MPIITQGFYLCKTNMLQRCQKHESQNSFSWKQSTSLSSNNTINNNQILKLIYSFPYFFPKNILINPCWHSDKLTSIECIICCLSTAGLGILRNETVDQPNMGQPRRLNVKAHPSNMPMCQQPRENNVMWPMGYPL